jgi:hypothetical protein
MRLRGEIVDLVRLGLLHDADEIGGVGHVSIVEIEGRPRFVRVVVQMVDALGIERRGPSLEAVHLSRNSAR